MTKQKTPLTELIEYIDSGHPDRISIREFAQSLRPKERDMIEDAWLDGANMETKTSRHYYTQTFEQTPK